MIFYVLSIQEKQKNKTVRYLEKKSINYFVLIPDIVDKTIINSYGKNAIVYNTNECKKYVDFCGTNIENGAAVGRMQSIMEAKKNKGISVCLDDDYGSITGSRPINTYDKNKLLYVIDKIYDLQKKSGIIFGGYSGGAIPNLKKNIMQIWLLDNTYQLNELNMILNEDVNFSIKKWHRGVANFGLATILRSCNQTAEMDKVSGNTQYIYSSDRSYRKSFGSILQEPKHAKLTLNRHNTKRGVLWHHKIYWSKITPMILDQNS